jgi:hypothetical protein
MEVTVKIDPSLLVHVTNKLLGIENSWMEESIWFLPFPIQITTKKRAPVITIYDTIRI